ncbi:class I SAM-dependent methyltransferase [Kitasatospora sp. MBT63]|uniref:class I SAM-dependent methyltransferase n=1 Tax=Kitasatospora sp. MBT63 TaxID=1444768 RepID=UPI00068CBA16|nr:class I SAM-dependent methyltransferase [Kitasatospora sp. MBT63]
MDSAHLDRPADSYRTGLLSKDLPTELDRLRALERSMDPTSIAILEALPIQPSWHCLEMGAGAGSMAYWLAKQCLGGQVVAADIDPRFLDARRAANLDVARIDLARHEFPPGTFDLIHSRAVLSHIPERDAVLRAAAGWLRPGGWLVVQDFVLLPPEPAAASPLTPFIEAMILGGPQQGNDSRWTRRMPAALTALGLERLQLRTTALTAGLGGPADELWRISLRQLAPAFLERGAMTEEQVATLADALERRTLVDFSFLFVSAWARRPLVGRPR